MKSDFMKTAGFSTLIFVCSCGSRKTLTVLGKHGARANEDAELEELRRMTKL